jgi:hypothetical protein
MDNKNRRHFWWGTAKHGAYCSQTTATLVQAAGFRFIAVPADSYAEPDDAVTE